MRNGWMTKSLCLACLGLSVILTAVATGQTAVGTGQSGTGSVLDRVQREDNRELGELIRIAVTNHKVANDQERSELVRKVTQSYAQIKLLDQQIGQLGRKIETTGGPADMRYELTLAKAELESKRTTELANLRELMGVIPRFPFQEQPIKSLNTWLSLNIVDERVVLLDAEKQFSGWGADQRHKVAGLMSEKETLDYVRERLKDRRGLPVRIDINSKTATGSLAQKLNDAIIALAIETQSQMEAEVHLVVGPFSMGQGCPFFLREGKIRTLYSESVKRPDDAGAKRLDSGVVELNDLAQSILSRLTVPMNVPITFRIEYDETSAQLAKQVADTVKAVAKRVGLAELVEVTGALVEPVPESAFLGRWQGDGQGEMQTIEVLPGGICQVTVGKGTEAIKAGTHVTGTWLPITKEIIIDIKDKIQGQTRRVYSGTIDGNGNLVINRGTVYSQGSFHLYGPSETIFQKVK